MTFLVLTRTGFEELQASCGRLASPLWLNPGVLTEDELERLRAAGTQANLLPAAVDHRDPGAVDAAVSAIRESDPGRPVWVERPADVARSPLRAAASGLRALAEKSDELFDRARLRLRKAAAGAGEPMIEPYLGYGTPDKLLFRGRVLKDEGFAAPAQASSGWQNLVELYKRLESDEVPGARLRARFNGAEYETVTDGEGYFSFEIEPDPPLCAPGWHAAQIEMAGQTARAMGEALVPPTAARFGVISDIDDTIVWTNVSNKLNMLFLLARTNAHTRKPFKGVTAFYRALRDGIGGREDNPFFYVSSSPWNLYAPLVEFMRLQDLPKGPLLLKDYGRRMLFEARDHHAHKLGCIERILQTYPQMQFVLIGDSGERDPEIYSQVVRMHPRRVRVIYIRNVNPDPSRIEAIDRLIEEVGRSGTQLVLAPDSEFAAAHAAAEGLIAARALDSVRLDKKDDEQAPDARP